MMLKFSVTVEENSKLQGIKIQSNSSSKKSRSSVIIIWTFIKDVFFTMIMMLKFSVTLEENTECQKLHIVEFKVTVSDMIVVIKCVKSRLLGRGYRTYHKT